MMAASVILITAALLAYSVGVWAERISGTLRVWHAVMFGIGLVCDASGTYLMSLLSNKGVVLAQGKLSGFLNEIMVWTGGLALTLMAIHLVWAVVVLVKGSERAKASFHKLSLIVWLIWLVPYFTGMAGGMLR